MVNRKIVSLGIITIFVVILTVVLIKQFVVINPKDELSNEYTPQQEILDEDLRKTIVTLYFKEKDKDNLVQEGRLIDAKLLLQNPYGTLIQMLILGPEASSYQKIIPDGTILNKVELNGDVLDVDFTKEFLLLDDDNNLRELAINSIKKTLTALNEVNDVKIFVDGKAYPFV